jgi:formate-dependent nitrite reductase membrane component NrfD
MSISEMSWGITLWLDLWCVGIASSSFLVAFIINKMSGGQQRNLFRLAVVTGLVFAMIGVILLLSHLGHLLWFWHMFVVVLPQSVLSLGGWILTIWLTTAGIMTVAWIARYFFAIMKDEGNGSVLMELVDKINGALAWVGLVFSILLVTYGGVLIATTSRPLWADTMLLPSLFVISAMCNGIGWLIMASLMANWATGSNVGFLKWIIKVIFGSSDWSISKAVIGTLAKALMVFLVIELGILAAFMIWLAAAAPDAFAQLVSGQMAVFFWIGLVGIGLVVPLLILLVNGNRGVASRSAVALVASSAGLAFIGGLILRAVLLVSAQL